MRVWGTFIFIDGYLGRIVKILVLSISTSIFYDLNSAECDSQLMSFAFGIFLFFKKSKVVRCRSPPLINLKKNSSWLEENRMVNRPKRRKHKDNPYTLECVKNNKYIVSFKDGKGILRMVEVSEEVYNSMDRFELDDLSELNEFDNHIEHSEIYEETLYKRVMDKPIELEDYIIQKSTFEDLKNAINLLPEIQKRRIKKYYFDDKTQQEIADEENVDIRAIQYSLNIALTNLKKILKK